MTKGDGKERRQVDRESGGDSSEGDGGRRR